MLSEICQTEKDNYCVISFIRIIESKKKKKKKPSRLIDKENRLVRGAVEMGEGGQKV